MGLFQGLGQEGDNFTKCKYAVRLRYEGGNNFWSNCQRRDGLEQRLANHVPCS
jgi:hypothetical protein